MLNPDVSFIPDYLSRQPGYLLKRSKAERDLQPPPSENIGRELRLGLTYVGLVGPNPNIQWKLRQVSTIGAEDCSKREMQIDTEVTSRQPYSYPGKNKAA